jgi:MFS family permease
MIINGASISMPSFLLYFGEMGPTGPYLPSIWTSLWTAMASLTQAVGSIAVGTISDKYGRKWPSCGASILTLAGTAVQFTAHSRGALMGGKMISGFGIGAIMAMGITYLAEVRLHYHTMEFLILEAIADSKQIAPVKLRAPLQSCLIIFIVTMQGLALGIVRILVPDIRERAFRIAFAIQWPVGIITLIAWAIAPE